MNPGSYGTLLADCPWLMQDKYGPYNNQSLTLRKTVTKIYIEYIYIFV